MAQFLPQVNLPEGLAQETIRLASQKNTPIAQGIASAGESLGQGIQAMNSGGVPMQARVPLNDSTRTIMDKAGVPYDPAARFIHKDIFDHASNLAVSKDRAQAMLDAIQSRSDISTEAKQLPIDQPTRDIFKQAGLNLDPKTTTIDERTLSAAKTIAAMKVRATGGAGSDAIPQIAASVFAGNKSWSQVAAPLKAQVQAYLDKKFPGFDYTSSDAKLGAVKQYYHTMNAPATQSTLKYMDSVIQSTDRIQEFAKKLDRTKYPTLNAIAIQGMKAAGNPDEMAFATDVTLVADEVAKILQGGGTGSSTSDAKLKQAGEILKTSYNPEQLSRVVGEIKTLIRYRKDAMLADTKVLPDFNAQKGEAHAVPEPGKAKAHAFLTQFLGGKK